ncbi:4-hydroxy-3-methylbut-2-enyl diphosphate reductase [Chitinophaga sp. GCM10012297]|uniref:4-hydroxy-3-methylbut-2-enyl diphosphate reductase n=1 Tax=Chitinophaga chungangae TaxID=2821488 RepID=A0ABS3YK23_9BACT|nr:4-hydroxy-3-methylbut-2-enyl diphosphate reductase [Chitinophaga chungangae]MBO9155037.1 4-hydroxy-3-methylbut-2-enyl diphosphate reductase [Chitinophaga chungangae]
MKTFNVPVIYRSPLISAIKQQRKQQDRMKKDFSPTLLDFGPLRILLARHFGFCYGVENAIEIAFRTVEENEGKRIFLLSEMIHNPQVNNDLLSRGVRFLMDTSGRQLIPWEDLRPDDIVIIPAFGTTLEIESRLQSLGIVPLQYNTTCPFVERVWNKAEQIGAKEYTVIVHGKPKHEETRATFSHSRSHTPTVVVKDMEQTHRLAAYILGEAPAENFYEEFKGQYSEGFDVNKHLQRVGVVNQTTMLASETQAIADYVKQSIQQKYGLAEDRISERFADTRDTLCYATNDNQTAVTGMLEAEADLAIVVGGYNSSNTSHLVELCEEKLPTYFISGEEKLLSRNELLHYDFHHHQELHSFQFLPEKEPVTLLLTSGASCPDAIVEGVIRKLLSFYGLEEKVEETAARFTN